MRKTEPQPKPTFTVVDGAESSTPSSHAAPLEGAPEEVRVPPEASPRELNGGDQPITADPFKAAALNRNIDLAEALLLPNPEALNTTGGEQLAIPVVNKCLPLEFFRTHPRTRLTLKMLTPNRGEIGAHDYAVMPAAEPALLRYRFEPYVAVLYPIAVDGRPLNYRLMKVTWPADGRQWDQWNLSRKSALEIAADKWIAMRRIKSGYEACEPDPQAKFPELVFPSWSEHEWLWRSFGVAGLIIDDENHEVFRAIKHL
jgi:hypothetical protein